MFLDVVHITFHFEQLSCIQVAVLQKLISLREVSINWREILLALKIIFFAIAINGN